MHSLGRIFSPQWLHVNAKVPKSFHQRHFTVLISTIVLFFLFMQWLCNADKSSHVPRLRLKYVLLAFMLAGSIIFLSFFWFYFIFLMIFSYPSFRAFFGSLYKCLARGARAVFQVYPENLDQRALITSYAMQAGFSGGVVVDFPHRFVRIPTKHSHHIFW